MTANTALGSAAGNPDPQDPRAAKRSHAVLASAPAPRWLGGLASLACLAALAQEPVPPVDAASAPAAAASAASAADSASAPAAASAPVPGADAASAPALAPSPARIKVVYSTVIAPNVALKEVPREVVLVRPEATKKNLGTQLALNAFLLVATGGRAAVANTFSKDDLNGISVPDVEDRRHLQNPVPDLYVESMRQAFNEQLETLPQYQGQAFKQPIAVAGGRAALIYESLMADSPTYYLQLELKFSKRKESISLFTLYPDNYLDCTVRSEQHLPLAQWSPENYKPVADELARLLEGCRGKALAQLGSLLAE